ncbi:hypothetical protein HDV03_004662 [Kappamyces sp. JEL0829]|nr:hypothetical protein HDV03_004662 [Kappamyces sp. JEL0829]
MRAALRVLSRVPARPRLLQPRWLRTVRYVTTQNVSVGATDSLDLYHRLFPNGQFNPDLSPQAQLDIVKVLKANVDRGDLLAMMTLSTFYQYTGDFERFVPMAEEFISTAFAKTENLGVVPRDALASTMTILGRCYIGGLGVAPDHGVGISWFEKAVSRGHLDALQDIAHSYFVSNDDQAQAFLERCVRELPPDSIHPLTWIFLLETCPDGAAKTAQYLEMGLSSIMRLEEEDVRSVIAKQYLLGLERAPPALIEMAAQLHLHHGVHRLAKNGHRLLLELEAAHQPLLLESSCRDLKAYYAEKGNAEKTAFWEQKARELAPA